MLDMLKDKLESINLKVNTSKTHILGLQKNRQVRAELRNLCFDHGIPDANIHHDYLQFLGSPIGDNESEEEFCTEKVNAVFDDLLVPLTFAFKNYNDTRAPKLQSLFQILRLCGYSRINHLFRTVDPRNTLNPATCFDDRMWELVRTLLSIPASVPEEHLARARTILGLPATEGASAYLQQAFDT
jgi:hypothetical protein